VRLLKFHATWCAPCKRVAPVVDAVAARHSVPVESIDIDQEPELSARYGVQSVPTLVLLDSAGQPVFTGVGADSLPDLQRALAAL
jgi:thioredoxin 1